MVEPTPVLKKKIEKISEEEEKAELKKKVTINEVPQFENKS